MEKTRFDLLLPPFEVEEELKKYHFTGLVGLMKPTFSVTIFSDTELMLSIELCVPDRDTCLPKTLYHTSYLHKTNLLKDKHGWKKNLQNHVYAQLVWFMKHEVKEGIMIDGVRVYEPH